MRNALEGEVKALARRIIQQFVAKVVIKEGTGTLYHIPVPRRSLILSYGILDPRGRVPLTRHMLSFDIDIPASTTSRNR